MAHRWRRARPCGSLCATPTACRRLDHCGVAGPGRRIHGQVPWTSRLLLLAWILLAVVVVGVLAVALIGGTA